MYVVGTHWMCLTEVLQMSTHYMFINGEIKKIIQELSSYTPSEANWSGSALFAIKYILISTNWIK